MGTPLSKQTAAVLGAWMKERGGDPDDPLFPTRRGTPINRGAVGRLVARHAAAQCPSLHANGLRYTCYATCVICTVRDVGHVLADRGLKGSGINTWTASR